mmetsp:Transcript_38013/g.44271  ORF Transcript_38013/g.44271 Transcript_38013/m.44271 type:complete len:164 (+) Transcript_38013:144-635(+)|eukprot:CAMPEP_0194365946 /NCGR_PEP_ID=MMETSP0174-20130528/13938_1 /TAXON_ID=216777 /ORGANISM="Proboscia alata, Strain PI-D3" /LENGTH=163 /DNA_ID=CAMNT_0039140851 /DNA_START=74 /DNA_END=565 /DNA_ORIENTATION=+
MSPIPRNNSLLNKLTVTVVLVALWVSASSFTPPQHLAGRHTSILMARKSVPEPEPEPKGNFFSNIFAELDNFVEDATSRRLGAGSQFYGKRKSEFYGKDDKGKKKSAGRADPTEDYRGPTNAGYFTWMKNEDTGLVEPVTRMKKKNIESNSRFWDKYFDGGDE